MGYFNPSFVDVNFEECISYTDQLFFMFILLFKDVYAEMFNKFRRMVAKVGVKTIND